ncbi:hypothetical protein PMM47T1_13850 [Pseudomonas sp. M47T1]|uniref:hypothetical protein n=1 Tax=Pseudomonas sp. M47T1 TaxID=1179778 RepID=UPI00026085E5|nr:hypothetical protein [Pseudomonas sp. M47T1]EIK96048.1 hypothetical protein PMM47T1_13850 [Pseudomonas sp. M47T1]
MATDDQDEYGFVPISFKPACRLGSQVMPSAKSLANNMGLMGQQSASRIRNGFLIRAVRLPQVTNVHIIDPPAMLMFAGWCAYATTSAPYTINNGLAPVGNRDDFTPPGYTGEVRSVYDYKWLQLGAPGDPPDTDRSEPYLYYNHMQPVLSGGYVVLGYMRIPNNFQTQYINDTPMNHFTDANTVRVGCAYRYPQLAIGNPTDSAHGSQYTSLNSFWVSEGELPTGWKLLPRRYSDAADSRGVIQTAADWAAWTPGANVIQATGESGDTTDQFLMAVQVVNQIEDTWTNSAGYAVFDQQGQHALALMRGTLDRTLVNPNDPQQIYATLASTQLILATDVSLDGIKPTPATVYASQAWAWYGTASGVDSDGAPERPSVAYFLQPQVQRCTDGFVTFCTYWAPYYASNPTTGYGTATGYAPTGVTLYSVLTVMPSGDCIALKGDAWTPQIGTFSYPEYQIPLPDIPDTDSAYSVVPWIVGSESIERTSSAGEVTRTAYALVWEEHRDRLNATIIPGEVSVPGKTFQVSYTKGGDWVLYSVESGTTPTRTVLTTADNVAPVFSLLMTDDNWMPGAPLTLLVNTRPTIRGSHLHMTYASCYHMGENLLVTAGLDADLCINTGIWVTGSDPADIARSDEHNIYCVVVDTVTGVVTKRGVITTRMQTNYNFHVTVAQPEVVATDTAAAKPAALLATQFSSETSNNGLENSVEGVTQVFLSVDGGYTWTVYVNDMAAPNGAFLIGNQLWNNDVTSRYDEGLAG